MRSMLYLVLFLFVAISLFATPPQDDNRRRPNRQAQGEQNAPPVREGMGVGVKSQPKLQVEDETIPDSLLHPRWKIKRTAPLITEDLDSSALDLHTPEHRFEDRRLLPERSRADDARGVFEVE